MAATIIFLFGFAMSMLFAFISLPVYKCTLDIYTLLSLLPFVSCTITFIIMSNMRRDPETKNSIEYRKSLENYTKQKNMKSITNIILCLIITLVLSFMITSLISYTWTNKDLLTTYLQVCTYPVGIAIIIASIIRLCKINKW